MSLSFCGCCSSGRAVEALPLVLVLVPVPTDKIMSVPFFLTHTPTCRPTLISFSSPCYSLSILHHSLQSIPAGAQVYDSYGQKCNHRFLLNYGFAVENNREIDGFCPNEVPIELFVAADDPLYERKLEFWVRGEGNALAAAMAAVAARQTPHAVVSAVEAAVRNRTATDSAPVKRVRVCVSNNENTRLLLSLLRALSCNEDELASITSSSSLPDGTNRLLFGGNGVSDNHQHLHHHNNLHHYQQRTMQTPNGPFYRSCRDIRHPISLRNERAAMMLLLEVIGRALAKYPTTLAQDVADLMDETAFPRFSNHRHARIQVRGEKEVLHHFARWARTGLDMMDIMQRELHTDMGAAGGVEVQLGAGVAEDEAAVPTFDEAIRQMEQDEGDGGLHLTIVRYCADVLGSLRREEIKKLRRQAPVIVHGQGNNNNNNNSSTQPTPDSTDL